VEPGELVASIYRAAAQSSIDRFNADIRAAVGGIVSDIRLRVGQQVLGGDIVGGVTRPEAGFEVLSFVPGAYAPLLSRGMPLTARVANYPDTEARLRVDHIGMDLVGPSDALKFAGPEGSSLALSGPVVIIRSTLIAPTFESDGRTYRYHDGLAVTSQLRVGSEPLLFSLFPGLKAQNP
jgi:membrane fusion protein (multidrug efflux system)